MSFPPPSSSAIVKIPTNPVEAFISSFNTNSYFIGAMMIILNLGGRHLATGLSVEQDRLFQNVWARRFLLFVVIFIATRNIFAAFWLSIAVIVILGFLTNESSSLYLFGDPVKPPPPPPSTTGLSQEESEMYKRLHDRVTKEKEKIESLNEDTIRTNTDSFVNSYMNTMKVIQSV